MPRSILRNFLFFSPAADLMKNYVFSLGRDSLIEPLPPIWCCRQQPLSRFHRCSLCTPLFEFVWFISFHASLPFFSLQGQTSIPTLLPPLVCKVAIACFTTQLLPSLTSLVTKTTKHHTTTIPHKPLYKMKNRST